MVARRCEFASATRLTAPLFHRPLGEGIAAVDFANAFGGVAFFAARVRGILRVIVEAFVTQPTPS